MSKINININTWVNFIGSLIGSVISVVIALISIYITNKQNIKRANDSKREQRKRNIPFLLIKVLNCNDFSISINDYDHEPLMIPSNQLSAINKSAYQIYGFTEVHSKSILQSYSIPVISIQNLSLNRLFNVIIVISYKNKPSASSFYFSHLVGDYKKYNFLYTDENLLKYQNNFNNLISKKIINKVVIWGLTQTRDVVCYECKDFEKLGGIVTMTNSLENKALKDTYKEKINCTALQRLTIFAV